jgi:hypothetical protein
VALQRPPDATASLRRPGLKPPTILGYKKVAAAPRNPSSLPSSPWPSLPSTRAGTRAAPPWPPPLAAARSHPDPLRARPQHRLASLVFLAQGIELERRESPPPSPFLLQEYELIAAKLAASVPSPAKPSSPECFW